MKGDAAAALTEFRAQYDVGADPAAVLTDLAEFNHLVTRLRFVPSAANDVSLSEDERRRGGEFAKQLSVRVLSRTWQMLIKGIPEVQASNRPASAADMVLIRIAHAADLPTLDEALKSLGDAPQSTGAPTPRPSSPASAGPGNGASAVAQGRMPVTSGGGQTMRLVETTPAPAEMPAQMLVPPQPVAGSPAGRAGEVAGGHSSTCGRQSRHAVQDAVQELHKAGSDRSGPSGRQPDRQRAQKPGRRSQRASRKMDRPALDGVGFARGRRADARRDGGRQEERRDPRCKERPGRRGDPRALSRREDHRRAHTQRAGGRSRRCRPAARAAADDDETDF